LNVNYYHNKSIDVVDDEEDIITLFTDAIQENDYPVMGFTNPLFILDYIREYQIDLV
jgi:hypothetical protein